MDIPSALIPYRWTSEDGWEPAIQFLYGIGGVAQLDSNGVWIDFDKRSMPAQDFWPAKWMQKTFGTDWLGMEYHTSAVTEKVNSAYRGLVNEIVKGILSGVIEIAIHADDGTSNLIKKVDPSFIRMQGAKDCFETGKVSYENKEYWALLRFKVRNEKRYSEAELDSWFQNSIAKLSGVSEAEISKLIKNEISGSIPRNVIRGKIAKFGLKRKRGAPSKN